MNLKLLNEPKELRIHQHLNSRMELSEKEIQQYRNLEKGYEGEVVFSELLEPLGENGTLLFDLLLEQNQTLFQIDASLLLNNEVYLFEVKNYCGDFYMDGEILRTISGNEVKSPIIQVKRSESLMRRLLSDMGGSAVKLHYYIVFVNPEFTLYQAPPSLKAIFPTQINRFIGKLKSQPAQISTKQEKLAEKLMERHIDNSPYRRLPEYDYGKLGKGVVCLGRGSLETVINHRNQVKCIKCGKTENHDESILRSIDEYMLLFPNELVTTSTILDWCSIFSIKAIRRVLNKYFTVVRSGKPTTYKKD
ncbi:nuclease-related domain-containing protein [Cytobacillus gottheilii]|uniref:NERD domain-containing protein n=1 Tax=Cytobacillus gottheilii TaxID=859144 RepID=A0ABX8FHM8_9BACI|nr:nuclease-related domain-containing protein [Cytobacillus gottheilii]QVY63495.1 NERD domain-containing protein [Cytobacillus gottheilii]